MTRRGGGTFFSILYYYCYIIRFLFDSKLFFDFYDGPLQTNNGGRPEGGAGGVPATLSRVIDGKRGRFIKK